MSTREDEILRLLESPYADTLRAVYGRDFPRVTTESMRGSRLGEYHDHDAIILNEELDLDPNYIGGGERDPGSSVLAHEMGHAAFGSTNEPTPFMAELKRQALARVDTMGLGKLRDLTKITTNAASRWSSLSGLEWAGVSGVPEMRDRIGEEYLARQVDYAIRNMRRYPNDPQKVFQAAYALEPEFPGVVEVQAKVYDLLNSGVMRNR